MPRTFLALVSAAWTLTLAACQPGGSRPSEIPLQDLVPRVPATESFGELYPRLGELLVETAPRTAEAVEFTRQWAEVKLAGFREGSCAPIEVLPDREFAFLFGGLTLGVTFPWMQLYTRDGKRDDGSFLWKSASLLASTVFHEYVHAAQRARQSARFLSHASSCAIAHESLATRMNRWTEGLDLLQSGGSVSGRLGAGETTLVYLWTSPISQARDEVEAALTTLQWMSEHPESLNGMTIGAVNNWVYGLEYAFTLKVLSTTNCFSPEPAAFAEEKKTYAEELPRFIDKLRSYEDQTRAFFASHGVSVEPFPFQDLAATAQPTGSRGVHCQSELGGSPRPRFEVAVRNGKGRPTFLRPIPIDRIPTL